MPKLARITSVIMCVAISTALWAAPAPEMSAAKAEKYATMMWCQFYARKQPGSCGAVTTNTYFAKCCIGISSGKTWKVTPYKAPDGRYYKDFSFLGWGDTWEEAVYHALIMGYEPLDTNGFKDRALEERICQYLGKPRIRQAPSH